MNQPSPSAKRKKYLQTKERLQAELGERCAKCSRTNDLEFDCVTPTGAEHHAMSLYDRVRYYERQYLIGNLQLLCCDCHRAKSATEARNSDDAFFRRIAADTLSEERNAAALGPMPDPSDWPAFCAWHRAKNGL